MNFANAIPFIQESPQPLLREIPRGEPYPVEALGPLESIVRAVHDKTQAPIAIAAQCALAVGSLAVQGLADIETLGGSSPCSLFFLTVAQSGERKSACDKLLMQAVREHESDAAAMYKVDYAQYETAQRLWEMTRNRLLKEASGTGAKSISARADLEAQPPAPDQPLSTSRTATDPTYEGLVKLFAIGKPALGLFTDEGGGFIGGHAMNSDNRLKTCSGLSGIWDGSPINRTRAGDGASTMPGRRLATHIMAQPVAVRPMLADPIASGQGFLARFLICEPESAIGTRTRRGYNPASDTALSLFSAKLRTALDADLPTKDGSRNELELGALKLSDGARESLLRYYEATEKAQAANGEFANVRPYASKSAEQAARLAGVLTLWQQPNAQEVSPETMADAVLLAKFYLSEAKRLVDAAVISEEIDRAEMLRKWLIEKWGKDHLLPSDVVRYGPNSLREMPKAKSAMKLLESNGWLVRLPDNSEIRGKHRRVAYLIERGGDAF